MTLVDVGYGMPVAANVAPAGYDGMLYDGAQLAPMGAWGNFISNVGRTVAPIIPNQNVRTGVGVVSDLARLLPFEADPYAAQLAPMGAWGNFISNVGRTAAPIIPNQNVRPGVGVVSDLPRLLPFDADPYAALLGI